MGVDDLPVAVELGGHHKTGRDGIFKVPEPLEEKGLGAQRHLVFHVAVASMQMHEQPVRIIGHQAHHVLRLEEPLHLAERFQQVGDKDVQTLHHKGHREQLAIESLRFDLAVQTTAASSSLAPQFRIVAAVIVFAEDLVDAVLEQAEDVHVLLQTAVGDVFGRVQHGHCGAVGVVGEHFLAHGKVIELQHFHDAAQVFAVDIVEVDLPESVFKEAAHHVFDPEHHAHRLQLGLTVAAIHGWNAGRDVTLVKDVFPSGAGGGVQDNVVKLAYVA